MDKLTGDLTKPLTRSLTLAVDDVSVQIENGIPAPLELEPVTAFTTDEDGNIVGLDVWCDGVSFELQNRVTLRWCRVWFRNCQGIKFGSGANGSIIGDLMVTHVEPPTGVNPFPTITDGIGQVCIYGYQAADIKIARVILRHGASGIYLHECQNIHSAVIEGGPFHGPYPRGQLYQENNCVNCSITEWSADNPVDASFPEDVINIYQSQNAYVGSGRAISNGAPNGVAVMFENGSTGRVVDVDATGMWNGAFSAMSADTDVVFQRVRTRDNYPPDQNPSGRMPPSSSNGATFVAGEGATAQIMDAEYFNVANPDNVRVEYNGGEFTAYSVSEVDFVARPPVSVVLPDWPDWVQPPENENLITHPNDVSNAAWTKVNVTVVEAQADDTGGTGAEGIRETTANGSHEYRWHLTKDASVIGYQFKFKWKPVNRTRTTVFAGPDAGHGSAAAQGYFFSTGPANFQAGSYGGIPTPTGSIVAIGGGFYECTFNFASTSATDLYISVFQSDADYNQGYVGVTTNGSDVMEHRLIEI